MVVVNSSFPAKTVPEFIACAKPPGAPAAAVDALRRAIARLNSDPGFAKEAQKLLQFVPHYVSSGDLNAKVRSNLVVKPEIREFVADYIKNPPR